MYNYIYRGDTDVEISHIGAMELTTINNYTGRQSIVNNQLKFKQQRHRQYQTRHRRNFRHNN